MLRDIQFSWSCGLLHECAWRSTLLLSWRILCNHMFVQYNNIKCHALCQSRAILFTVKPQLLLMRCVSVRDNSRWNVAASFQLYFSADPWACPPNWNMKHLISEVLSIFTMLSPPAQTWRPCWSFAVTCVWTTRCSETNSFWRFAWDGSNPDINDTLIRILNCGNERYTKRCRDFDKPHAAPDVTNLRLQVMHYLPEGFTLCGDWTRFARRRR